MRVVYFASGRFALPSLQALLAAGHDVRALVTQPDRPAGRGRKLRATPAKEAALAAGIEVFEPQDLRGFEPELRALRPDVAVVASYGRLVPGPILAIPDRGSLNLHGSLLPLLRGAAPIQRALMEGHEESGVTLMLMDEGLDTGCILAQSKVPVADDDDAGSLEAKLADTAAELLVGSLPAWERGGLEPKAQDEALATEAPPITAGDRVIDWSLPARRLHDRIRGLAPSPGAFTLLGGERLLILKTRVVGEASPLRPATAVVREGRLLAAAGSGLLELVTVKPAGKGSMSGAALANGLRLSEFKVGEEETHGG
ncbi:MAG: methionyl-tRNA formyltransferase [Candidatus Geothermincolia bacterium]